MFKKYEETIFDISKYCFYVSGYGLVAVAPMALSALVVGGLTWGVFIGHIVGLCIAFAASVAIGAFILHRRKTEAGGEPEMSIQIMSMEEIDALPEEERASIKEAIARGASSPRSIVTGEEMPEEVKAAMRAMLAKGDGLKISDENRKHMEAAGLTEDDLRAALLKSVKGNLH